MTVKQIKNIEKEISELKKQKQKLIAGKGKPPKKEFDKHFKKVQSLINGKEVKIYLKKLDSYVITRIYWEEDRHVNFGLVDFIPKNKGGKFILDFILSELRFDLEELISCDEIERPIMNSAVFKAMDKEIKALCKQATQWEEKYNFDWDKEVLSKISNY